MECVFMIGIVMALLCIHISANDKGVYWYRSYKRRYIIAKIYDPLFITDICWAVVAGDNSREGYH